MVSIYHNFAFVYDKLMHDVNYSEWVEYIESIFKTTSVNPSLVLDLGCGTGSFCIEMAKKGYDMIGIDQSEDMLSCAKEKTLSQQLDIMYLHQDMTDFELYGTVDAIVCLMDSINYITHKKAVKKVFKLVRNYLNSGGIFVFDINSKYKLKNVLGNNVFYEVGDEISYIWANEYTPKKEICTFDLTIFVKEDEHYIKYDEVHYERAYSVDDIKTLVEDSGLKLLHVYDALGFGKPRKKSERIFFVCQKV